MFFHSGQRSFGRSSAEIADKGSREATGAQQCQLNQDPPLVREAEVEVFVSKEIQGSIYSKPEF